MSKIVFGGADGCACVVATNPTKDGDLGLVRPMKATEVGLDWLCDFTEQYTSIVEEAPEAFDNFSSNRGITIRRSAPKWNFVVQSKGSHGYDPYLCKTQFLPITMERATKCFKPCAVTIAHELCPNNWIDTEFDEGLIDSGLTGTGDDKMAWLRSLGVMAFAAMQLGREFSRTVMVGIGGGRIDGQNHFHGIIAQSYLSADPAKLNYHSINATLIDSASVEAGTNCVWLRVGGVKVKLSVDGVGDPTQTISLVGGAEYVFATYDELKAALTDLIGEVCAVNEYRDGETYAYSSVMVDDVLTITANNPRDTISLNLVSVPCDTEIDWSCMGGQDTKYNSIGEGWTFECLQHALNTSDYALLGTYQKITKQNAGAVLEDYVCDAIERMDSRVMETNTGETLGLVALVDPKIVTYLQYYNKQYAARNFGAQFEVSNLSALRPVSSLRGTGLVVITTENNIIPMLGNGGSGVDASRFTMDYDSDCETIKFKYKTYFGIEIKCFGGIWINTCGNEWATKNLTGITPQKWETNGVMFDGASSLPCYSEYCAGNTITDECNVSGKLSVVPQTFVNTDGSVQIIINSEIPINSTTETPSYTTDATFEDGTVISSTTGSLVLDFATEADVLDFQIKAAVTAGSCGSDVKVSAYNYTK